MLRSLHWASQVTATIYFRNEDVLWSVMLPEPPEQARLTSQRK